MSPQPNPHDESRDAGEVVGRCDWCGETIRATEGDQFSAASISGVDEWNVTAEEAVASLADTVEELGTSKDAVLADSIRENNAYRLHEACFYETSLTEIFEGP